jgi:hypothetical protein
MEPLARRNIERMSVLTLWCEFGLHKGLIAEEHYIRHEGTSREREIHFRYFNIGHEDFIGLCDTFSRRAMWKSHYAGCEWFTAWERSDKGSKWQGPATSPRASLQAINHQQERAAFVLDILHTKGKPTLVLSQKPKLIMKSKKPTFRLKGPSPFKIKNQIAYEDRPDVGVEFQPGATTFDGAEAWNARPKPKLFKIKGKS